MSFPRFLANHDLDFQWKTGIGVNTRSITSTIQDMGHVVAAMEPSHTPLKENMKAYDRVSRRRLGN